MTQMFVNTDLLNDRIDGSGLKIKFICEKLGLSRQGFNDKRINKTPFTVPEVFVLCSLLMIKEDEKAKIFREKVEL